MVFINIKCLNIQAIIFEFLVAINSIMYLHTPEKTTIPIEDSFLKYPPNTKNIRQQFSVPKTLAEIRARPPQKIADEYKILSKADIEWEIFNVENLGANRYSDIFAYQHSRLKIPEIQSYYINANEVKSIVDSKPFAIFSQAPYKQYDSFWEGVYYKNVDKVIMLCKFFDPNRGHQSEQYWPDEGKNKTFSINKLKVSTISSKSLDEEFTETQFKIEGPKGQKIVTHYHWTGWSDLKRPLDHTMDKFEFLIDMCLKQIEEERLIWIHCSAGIGRTGTLGGVLEGIRFYKKYNKISIFAIVENMRKYRYHAVQTFDQYKFLYSYLMKKL